MEKEKKSILRTITDVIGALIVLAIICVLVWYFLIRDPFPTTLTEEMMTSDALIGAVEEAVVDDLNERGVNDVLWETNGVYILYAEPSVPDLVVQHPSIYMVGERVEEEKDSAQYIYADVIGLVDGNDAVYRYDFAAPINLDLVVTDGETESRSDVTHNITVEGYILLSSFGFTVSVTEVEYMDDLQQALDTIEVYGWLL